jgi:serine/threonine protein kinase/ribosome-associated protein YbcJ (S4-like RNA binding protein)
MKICSHCGYYNKADAPKCIKCGFDLSRAATVTKNEAIADKDIVPEAVDLHKGDEVKGIKNKYHIVNSIDKGGYGLVYLAKDQEDTQYALKVIEMRKVLPNEHQEIRKRFEREFEAGQIHSDYIVNSMDKGSLQGNPFIVMEYCPKGNLRDQMLFEWSDEETHALGLDILRGLNDLHTSGIIHKDLKPENILFTEQNRAQLTDFGIAGFIKRRETQRNLMGYAKNVFGTAIYAPPEQLNPQQAFKIMGPTNDIFAFGVIMYEVFTQGHLPFGSYQEFEKDMPGYYKRIKKGKLTKIHKVRKDVPSDWQTIIHKCLAPKYKDRYQSANDILKVLGQPARETPQYVAKDMLGEWSLRIMNGEEVGRVYNLSKLVGAKGQDLLTLGWFNAQQPFSNDIGIVESFTKYVSGKHATLERVKQKDGSWQWFIRDGQWYEKNGKMGWHLSRNGVLVNSAEVKKSGYKLKPDDIITIGDTTLKVQVEY